MEEVLDAQENAVELDLKNLFLNFVPFSPMVEPGGELPEQPLYALQAGKIDPMPMLQGSLYDEGQLFVYELFTKPLGEKEYNGAVKAIFGRDVGKQVLGVR